MHNEYWYDRYPRGIDRAALTKVAQRLKAELDRLHDECAKCVKTGEDFDALWAESKGVFFAYRQIADLLGWQ